MTKKKSSTQERLLESIRLANEKWISGVKPKPNMPHHIKKKHPWVGHTEDGMDKR